MLHSSLSLSLSLLSILSNLSQCSAPDETKKRKEKKKERRNLNISEQQQHDGNEKQVKNFHVHYLTLPYLKCVFVYYWVHKVRYVNSLFPRLRPRAVEPVGSRMGKFVDKFLIVIGILMFVFFLLFLRHELS